MANYEDPAPFDEPELPFDEDEPEAHDAEWHREHDVSVTGHIKLPSFGPLGG